MIRHQNNKGAVLSTVATIVFLVVFTVTLIFLTVYIALIQLRGTAGGTAALDIETKSLYSDERAFLYMTDEHGNKVTDLIGQALLYPAGATIIIPDNIINEDTLLQVDNSKYTCSGSTKIGGTYDTYYKVSRVDLNRYTRCYLIPNKLGRMYGPSGYCLFAIYDEGGPAQRNITFGNDTMSQYPDCGKGVVISSEITPPPGYPKPITIRLQKA